MVRKITIKRQVPKKTDKGRKVIGKPTKPKVKRGYFA